MFLFVLWAGFLERYLLNSVDCFLSLWPVNRKLGDGLFLQCCEEVAELYPKIKFETMIIDNCCMQVRPFVSFQRVGSGSQSIHLSLSLWNSFLYSHISFLAGAESLPV